MANKKYPVRLKRTGVSEIFKINATQIIVTHSSDKCKGHFCCLHNPSKHHMRDWPLVWRADKGAMERLCPEHGVGHPDPDDAAYNERIGKAYNNIHGCCGCCHEQPVKLVEA